MFVLVALIGFSSQCRRLDLDIEAVELTKVEIDVLTPKIENENDSDVRCSQQEERM